LDNLSSTETDIDQFVRSKVPSLAEAKLVGLTEQVVSGTIYCYSYSDASEEKSSADAEEANDQHDEETKGSDAEGPSSNSEDSSSEGEEADAETVEICVNSIPW
jgi:cobalamin biosynthesis protein CobT